MGRCVVQTGLGRIAECVLTLSLLGLVSCSEPDPQPSISVSPVASSPAPSRTASPTPSAHEQNLREAERACLPVLECHRSSVGRPRLRSDRTHEGFARFGSGPVGEEHQSRSLRPR